MAHELEIVNGVASMAYAGEKPWHGLGQELQQGASFEEWQKAAGMDWFIKSAPVAFGVGVGLPLISFRYSLPNVHAGGLKHPFSTAAERSG
mgnify:CR=1 FL=1